MSFDSLSLRSSLFNLIVNPSYRKKIDTDLLENPYLQSYLDFMGYKELDLPAYFAIEAFRANDGIPIVSKPVLEDLVRIHDSPIYLGRELEILAEEQSEYYHYLSILDSTTKDDSSVLGIALLLYKQYKEDQL